MGNAPEFNPATSAMLGLLRRIGDTLAGILDATIRRERLEAGLFRVTNIYRPNSNKMRVKHWVIASSGTAQIALMVGTVAAATVEFSAAGTLVIPLAITINRGMDVSTVVVAGAGTVTDSFLVAFTE